MNGASMLHHLNAWDEQPTRCASRITPTGLPGLDELLPDGGWPKAGVVELTTPEISAASTELFLPALARLSRLGRRLVLVMPPWPARQRIFSDPALDPVRIMQVNPHPGRSLLWIVESLLQSGDYGVVMAWPGCTTELMDKRLQNAATQGKSLCVLFRPPRCDRSASGIGLRLRLDDDETGRALYLLNGEGIRQAGIAWDGACG